MFKNYLKTALRNLRRQKVFSFINIAGLALSLMTVWLIALFIYDELSYDTYHKNAERIYRVAAHGEWDGGKFDITGTPAPMADALQKDFPEIESAVRMDVEGGGVVSYDSKTIKDDAIFLTDPSFFSVFTHHFLEGNAKALAKPNSIVLTKTLAGKLFKDPQTAINKTLKIDNTTALVTGVIDNVPSNSHFTFNALRPLPKDYRGDWGNLGIYTYLLFKPNASVKNFRNKMPAFAAKYLSQADDNVDFSLEIQPLTDIHLHSHLSYELGENHDIKYVYILLIVGLLILAIALINYINITTARASVRLREVAVRKIIGSGRKDLISLFLTESVTTIFSAALLSVILVAMVLPLFNTVIGKDLSTWSLGGMPTVLTLIIFSAVAGLIGGLYPALFLSKFKTIPALKNQLGDVKGQVIFRKGLVMFQFAITMIMISASLVIYMQLNYVQNKDLGFNKKQLLTFHLDSRAVREKEPLLREALLQNPSVEAVASASNPIGNNNIGMIGYNIETNGVLSKTGNLAHGLTIDEDFIPALQIRLLEGRNFSRSIASDTMDAIVNQALLRKHGWKTGIGKRISRGADSTGKILFANIIGVVRDYHLYSLQHKIEPVVMALPQQASDKDNMYVRIKSHDPGSAVAEIESTFRTFDAANPFEYHFLDQNFAAQYNAEEKQGQVLLAFTILTICIACLGLFGLITFTVGQRVREIGIRKVLGASVSIIVTLLTGSLLKVVLVATFIAVPVSWFAMHKWLEDFAYRINLSWWIFGIAAIIAIVIALVTLSLQAIKAAIANPVESLRME